MESICILPPEVIYLILCFSSPRDVVRLRLVSKQFYGLTFDSTVWRALYTSACLPRPPGPFPSQSVQFLERTLVQSERLAHSWTVQPIADISTIAIPIPGLGWMPPIIIYGRWLVSCESYSKFVMHDLDSSSEPVHRQILWESASQVDDWDACPVVSTSGLLIHIVFHTTTGDLSDRLKLLEFRLNGDSFDHTLALDVPAKKPDNTVYVEGGRSPFLFIEYEGLIFDAETRSFYELPPFKSSLVPSDSHSGNRVLRRALLTKTHVIALFHHTSHAASRTIQTTLMQAFVVPPEPRLTHDCVGALRLSHEGLIPDHLWNPDLVRNSIVDAASGATRIRLLNQSLEGDDLSFSCIDLTLPGRSSNDAVLPMAIDVHDVAHVNHGPFAASVGHMHYVEASDDGYARGFWRIVMPHGPSGDIAAPFPVMRFTIDASQDRCVTVFGQISAPQWARIHDPPWSRSIFFDGVRGRLYYDKIRYVMEVDDYETAIVINVR